MVALEGERGFSFCWPAGENKESFGLSRGAPAPESKQLTTTTALNHDGGEQNRQSGRGVIQRSSFKRHVQTIQSINDKVTYVRRLKWGSDSGACRRWGTGWE